MIFQNPTSAFNPVFTIGAQMSDVLAAHDRERGDAAAERIRSVLASVGMPDVERVMRAYPHQLSGGMLQRAMIATALLCRPRLLIADEPTTALDVTIAAQILALLRRLQREEGFSVMLITHDLGVVRSVCDRVAVLYAGRVVETAPTEALFAAPQHPYTRGLLAAVPRTSAGAGPLRTIPGSVPTDIGSITGLCLRGALPHRRSIGAASRRRPACRGIEPVRARGLPLPGAVDATRARRGARRRERPAPPLVRIEGAGAGVPGPRARTRARSIIRAVDGVDLSIARGRGLRPGR